MDFLLLRHILFKSAIMGLLFCNMECKLFKFAFSVYRYFTTSLLNMLAVICKIYNIMIAVFCRYYNNIIVAGRAGGHSTRTRSSKNQADIADQ